MHTASFPIGRAALRRFLIVQPMKLLTKSFFSADYRKNSLPVQRGNDDDAYSKCVKLRPADVLDISSDDAKRLKLHEESACESAVVTVKRHCQFELPQL